MNDTITIVIRNISDLKDAEYNPRKISESDRQELSKSINRFGSVEPIVVNVHPKRKDIIIGGHMRVQVLKEMGADTVPAVEVSLTEKAERDLNVRLNRAGSWKWQEIARMFTDMELKNAGFDEQDLLMAVGELTDVMEDCGDEGEATSAPPISYGLTIAFESEAEWEEAKENYVGADAYERTLNLIKFYAQK